MIFYGLFGSVIGARPFYAIQHLNAYLANPLGLVALDTNALNTPGGLFIGMVIALLFGRRRKLPLRPTLDALVPGLAVVMVAVDVASILRAPNKMDRTVVAA